MTSFERKFVMKHTFSGVSKFEEKKEYLSDKETHFSAPWKFCLSRESGYLASCLHCDFENGKDGWEIAVQVEMKLISPNRKSSWLKFNGTFDNKHKGWGRGKLLKWEDMLDKYAVDDKVTLEYHVKITKTNGIVKKRLRNFDEKVNHLTDATLYVKDRKFNILRGTLAGQSSHFKTLFFGTTAASRKKNFELKNIDPDDFQDFLDALHGEAAIIDDNVERMLKLAKKYSAPTVTKKCQEFLIDKAPELPMKEKLRISVKFELKNLKNDCLSKIVSISDIRAVIPDELDDLDPSVMAALFKKTLSLPGLN